VSSQHATTPAFAQRHETLPLQRSTSRLIRSQRLSSLHDFGRRSLTVSVNVRWSASSNGGAWASTWDSAHGLSRCRDGSVLSREPLVSRSRRRPSVPLAPRRTRRPSLRRNWAPTPARSETWRCAGRAMSTSGQSGALRFAAKTFRATPMTGLRRRRPEPSPRRCSVWLTSTIEVAEARYQIRGKFARTRRQPAVSYTEQPVAIRAAPRRSLDARR
jgi:hypothetical protein